MKIKWIPAWVLACALILFCLPAKASPDNPVISSAAYLPLSRDVSGTIEETGSCGVGLTYQVIKTGSSWGNNHYTLVISGNGRMNDYQKETAPWRHFGNANFYSIVLNEGLTHIGDYAFNYFYNVGKITLPQSLVSIGRNAFDNCLKLDLSDGIRFPYGLKVIGANAFLGCTSLTGGLSLPDSITSIGESAFRGCSGLTGTLKLPGGLKAIPEQAFAGCSNLSGSITLPHGLTSIGDSAFYGCKNLTGRLVLPEGLTYLGASAFGECSGFTGTLSIPKSLSKIGTNCFYNCSGIAGTLTLPASITTIGSGAFAKCTGIIEVHFEGAMPVFEYRKYDWRAFYGMTVEGFYPSSWTTKPESSFQGGVFHWHHPGSDPVDPNPNTPPKAPAAKTLQVTFNKNASSATLSTKSKTVTAGSSYGSLPTPKRKGYSFTGWYTKKSGGKKVTASTKVTSTKSHTLYARWTKTYTLRYHLNGGKNNKKNPTSYTKATPTFRLYAPSRKGYRFVNWYTSNRYQVSVNKIKKGSTGNRSFYAKWKKITYKITYKTNGGSVNKRGKTSYTITSKFSLPTPKRSGWKFLGWYDKSGKKVTKIKKGSTGNKILTAKWKRPTYKITYQLNGGTNHPDNPSSFTAAKRVTLKNPSRTGYTFLGWYSSGKKITKIPKGTSKNQKLTAKWKANTYKIRFDGNGATSGSMSAVTCTYGKSVKLPANRYTCASYPFRGWSLSPAGEPAYSNRAAVKNLTAKKNGTVTLYAVWDRGKYSKIQYTLPSPAFYQYDRYYNGEDHRGDCAVASIAILRTMKNNGKSASQNYEDVWAANGRMSYLNNWAALGLRTDTNVSLENIYEKLKSGPVICHRQGNGTHFSVIYAYVGNNQVLEKSGFLVYDVKDVVNQNHLADNLAKWDNYNNEGPLVKIIY